MAKETTLTVHSVQMADGQILDRSSSFSWNHLLITRRTWTVGHQGRPTRGSVSRGMGGYLTPQQTHERGLGVAPRPAGAAARSNRAGQTNQSQKMDRPEGGNQSHSGNPGSKENFRSRMRTGPSGGSTAVLSVTRCRSHECIARRPGRTMRIWGDDV